VFTTAMKSSMSTGSSLSAAILRSTIAVDSGACSWSEAILVSCIPYLTISSHPYLALPRGLIICKRILETLCCH
jgi:hypothetical protein